MAALDLLGRRWALRILWELRAGALPFRALREAAGDVSPAVLNTRLTELREAGLVESTPLGYATTTAGRELCRALEPLQSWAQRWSRGS
jgi:DNA-binding HxlR family transcriptional regulator